MSFPLILAAGPGDVITVAIFLIAAISGLMNFIKDRRAATNRQFEDRPKQNRPRTREEEELQSEIEAFLTEVSSSGNAGRSRPEQQTQPRPQGQKQRRKKKAPEAAKPESADAQKSVSQRHLPAGNLGGVGQRHMGSSVQDRHIDSSVAGQHLQPGSAFNASGPQPAKATAGFAAMLSQAGGVRNAIILSEVLGPPVAKRKR